MEDHVFLKVSSTKGMIRFGVRGNPSPRFIDPFEILERIGVVAYHFSLPPSLARVHSVLHVSMLRKYIHDPSHVVKYGPLQLREDLSYKEWPVRIMNRKDYVLMRCTISYIKV